MQEIEQNFDLNFFAVCFQWSNFILFYMLYVLCFGWILVILQSTPPDKRQDADADYCCSLPAHSTFLLASINYCRFMCLLWCVCYQRVARVRVRVSFKLWSNIALTMTESQYSTASLSLCFIKEKIKKVVSFESQIKCKFCFPFSNLISWMKWTLIFFN
jgi:hypothetical protein